MGDAYRGLTIKIGADTTKLSSALGGIRRAARSTQADLNKMNKALRLDPGNLALAEGKMRLMENSARQTAIEFARLRSSAKEIGASLNVKSFSSLIAGTKDAYYQTQKYNTELNSTNKKLETLYNEMARIRSGHSKGKAFEKEVESIRELASGYQRGTREAVKFQNALIGVAQNAKFADPFEYGANSAAKYLGIFERLKRKWHELDAEYSKAKKIEGLQSIYRDAMLAESKIRATTKELAQMERQVTEIGNTNFQRLSGAMESVESASREARAQVERMNEAVENSPHSFDAARGKMKAMQQEQEALTKQAELYRKKLEALGPAVKAIAESEENVYIHASKVEQQWSEATAKIMKLEGVLDRMKTDTAEIGMKANYTGEQYEKSYEKVKKLEAALDRLKTSASGLNAEMRQLQQARLYTNITGNLAATNGQIEALGNRSNKARANWTRLGESMTTVGYSLYSTITPAVSMVGMYAVSSAEEVDSAYRDMRKTVNGTEEQFESLRSSALEFSRTHFTSADQMLEIEAIGGQLGVLPENLEKFGEVVANLDIATNMDAETISQNLGQLSNIMKDMDQSIQTGPGSIEAFSDSLVRLGNNSAAQEDKIMNVMMRVASMGTISGMTTPELLALATATAAAGQGSEAAGTALSRTFSNIESAVTGAQGLTLSFEDVSAAVADGGEELEQYAAAMELTAEEFRDMFEADPTAAFESLRDTMSQSADKLETFAKVSGMSAEDFARAWNERPMEAFQAFIEGLHRIDEEGGSVDGTLKDLGINSVRQKQTLENLANTTDVLAKSLDMSNDAWNGMSTTMADGSVEEAGDAAREAGRKAEGFSGSMQLLRNNAQNLAVTLGDTLAPMINNMSDMLKTANEILDSMPDGMKQFAVQTALGVAAIGPFSIAFGGIVRALHASSTAFKTAFAAETLLNNSMKLGAVGNKLFDAATVQTGRSVTTMGTKAKAAAVGIKALSTAMNVAKFAGYAAAVAAVIYTLSQLYEAVKTSYDAHAGLSKSLDAAKASIDGFATSADAARAASEGLVDSGAAKSNEEVTQSLADLKSGIDQATEQFESSTAPVQAYADTIRALGNKSDLSAEETNTLKTAIEKFNEACGTTLGLDDYGNVIDTVTGKYANLNKELAEGLDIMKQQAVISAYSSQLESALVNQADAQKTLREERQKLADMEERYGTDSDKYKFQEANVDIAEKNLYDATKAVSDLTVMLDEATAKENELTEARNKAAKAAEMEKAITADETGALARLSDAVGGDPEKFFEISNAIGALGLSAEQLANVDMSKLSESFGGNMDQVLATLEAGGVSMDDFRAAMEKAGVDAELFGSMSAKTFNGLLETFGGDIDEMMSQLATFDAFKIGDKTYYVGDNGRVYDEMGNLQDLASRIQNIPDAEIHVNDDGSVKLGEWGVMNLTKAIEEIEPGELTIDDDGTVRVAGEEVGELVSKMEDIPESIHTEAEVDANTVPLEEKVDKSLLDVNKSVGVVEIDGNNRPLYNKLNEAKHDADQTVGNMIIRGNNTGAKSSAIEAANYARSTSSSISITANTSSFWSTVSSIANKVVASAIVNVVGRGHADAEGGFIGSGYNAYHAKGGFLFPRGISYHEAGYIANKETLANYTNGIAHIVGEAGAEAVIPLSNRRYVRPFAKAVANEIPVAGGTAFGDIHIYGAPTDSPEDFARRFMRETRRLQRT